MPEQREFDVTVKALKPTPEGPAIGLDASYHVRGANAREVHRRFATRADELGCIDVEITVTARDDAPLEG